MNRRRFALALPAAAGLFVGCRRTNSVSLNSPELLEAMRSMESAIGGLSIDVSSVDQNNCVDMTSAVAGAAAQVRDSYQALKKSLGVPDS